MRGNTHNVDIVAVLSHRGVWSDGNSRKKKWIEARVGVIFYSFVCLVPSCYRCGGAMAAVRRFLLLSTSCLSQHRLRRQHHHLYPHSWAATMIRRSWDPLPPRRSHTASSLQARAGEAHDEELCVDDAQQGSLQRGEGEGPHEALPHQEEEEGGGEKEMEESPEHPVAAKITPGVPRPRSRPGFNSYLKIDLHDEVLQSLRQIVQTAADDFEVRARWAGGDDRATADKWASSIVMTPTNNNKERAHKIKPRSLESLHMTLFFGGETLCQVDKGPLEDLHRRFTSVIQSSGFVGTTPSSSSITTDDSSSESSTTPDTKMSSTTSPDDFWFIIKDVRLFPPRRHNLVVAILEAAPAWHALHNDLRAAARAVPSNEIQTVLGYSKENWVSHITLANINGPKGRSNKQPLLQRLQELLRDSPISSSQDNNDDSQPRIFAKGISMGGPMPTQVELDWNFSHFRGVDTK
jgi:2'-5' RNA ligase